MILPASVTVTKAAEILPSKSEEARGTETGASGVRVISRNAVVDETDKMCTSSESRRACAIPRFWKVHVQTVLAVLIVKPNSSSSVRHHGEQGTYLSFSDNVIPGRVWTA